MYICLLCTLLQSTGLYQITQDVSILHIHPLLVNLHSTHYPRSTHFCYSGGDILPKSSTSESQNNSIRVNRFLQWTFAIHCSSARLQECFCKWTWAIHLCLSFLVLPELNVLLIFSSALVFKWFLATLQIILQGLTNL